MLMHEMDVSPCPATGPASTLSPGPQLMPSGSTLWSENYFFSSSLLAKLLLAHSSRSELSLPLSPSLFPFLFECSLSEIDSVLDLGIWADLVNLLDGVLVHLLFSCYPFYVSLRMSSHLRSAN